MPHLGRDGPQMPGTRERTLFVRRSIQMSLNSSVVNILSTAYGPCQGFSGPCAEMRWDPPEGHVPRGFLGAAGALEEIELVLVFAEPGDPHEGETHEGLASAYDYATFAFKTGKDQFHRNVRAILDACWPQLSFEDQMKKGNRSTLSWQ
jgi:hypothetical protein